MIDDTLLQTQGLGLSANSPTTWRSILMMTRRINKFRITSNRIVRKDGKLTKEFIIDRTYHDLEIASRVYNFMLKYHPTLKTDFQAL